MSPSVNITMTKETVPIPLKVVRCDGDEAQVGFNFVEFGGPDLDAVTPASHAD